jgi:hypothetical protein
MFKRVVLLFVLSLAAVVVAVTASATTDSAEKQTAGRGMLVGFYDDEQIYGRTDWAFTQLKSLRAGIVRVTLDWAAVAKRRPADAADPADPAYNWTAVDNVITKAAQNRMRVVLAVSSPSPRRPATAAPTASKPARTSPSGLWGRCGFGWPGTSPTTRSS